MLTQLAIIQFATPLANTTYASSIVTSYSVQSIDICARQAAPLWICVGNIANARMCQHEGKATTNNSTGAHLISTNFKGHRWGD